LIYYYFQFAYFGTPHVIKNNRNSPAEIWSTGLQIFLLIGFWFARTIAYVKFTYFLLQLHGVFNSIHGPLETFDIIEIYLWMLPTFFYVGDVMMFNKKFLNCMDSTFTLCNNLWEKIKLALHNEKTTALQVSLKKNVFGFFKHSL